MELHFKELARDILTLLHPKKTELFFRTVRIKPFDEMMTYLFMFGSFTFLGYFLRHAIFVPPIFPVTAIKISLIYYLFGFYVPTGILSILFMSYMLNLFGGKIVGRKIGKEEALMVVGYSAIPQLIGGFFGIVPETWVLHLLLIAYSFILLYIGMKVAFGFESSIKCLVFTIAIGSIFSLLLFRILVMVLGVHGAYYGL